MSERIVPTRGERILLNRLRRGTTQAQAAAVLGLSVGKMRQAERDGGRVALVTAPLGKLKDHERCLLMRRRAGYTQARVARDLKICRNWVGQMERGEANPTLLLWYWES